MRTDRTALTQESGSDDAARTRRGRLTYTVAEAAELLGVSIWTYYRGLQRGELPGRKLHGRWVVSRLQLHHFVDGEINGQPAAVEQPTPAPAARTEWTPGGVWRDER